MRYLSSRLASSARFSLFTYTVLLLPDGTFQLTRATNSALSMYVMEHVTRIPRKCHKFFLHQFVTLVSLKVPSGCTGE